VQVDGEGRVVAFAAAVMRSLSDIARYLRSGAGDVAGTG
jgi:hypothetical protein